MVNNVLSVAKDCQIEGIRCNTVPPARIHTHFVAGFITENYSGQEAEIFKKLSKNTAWGRQFMYGLSVTEKKGENHAISILKIELQQVMEQISSEKISDFSSYLKK